MKGRWFDCAERVFGGVGSLVLLSSAAAVGQLYAPGGVVPNPYARGYQIRQNPIVRRFSPNMTNPYITGNVTGGRSFQGFSPIRDPSSLFLSSPSNMGGQFGGTSGLPSDHLSNFTRDSFSIADVRRGRQMFSPTGNLYYSPQSTVTNTGAIIRGLNRPGTSQVQSPYYSPRSDFHESAAEIGALNRSRRGVSSWSMPRPLVRADTGQTLTGQLNRRLLSSPLFGSVVRQTPRDALAAQSAHDQSLGKPAGGPLDLRTVRGPLNLRVDRPSTGPLASRRSVVPFGSGTPMERLLGRRLGPAERAAQVSPEEVPLRDRVSETTSAAQPPRDLFSRMQASARSWRRTQDKLTGLPQAVPRLPGQEAEGPTDMPRPGTATPQAARPGEKQPGFVVKTFVGSEESVINSYLAEAEQHLKAGDYYRASTSYSLARTVDASNPLPLVGRSMALLAAGDYISSSTDLFHAIRLFESLAHFRIDLKSFVPNLEALDRRRADLEQRLEDYDDFRLRFLLGYAEYYSGFEKSGVANMKQATQVVPEAMATSVQAFVEVLERRLKGEAPPGDASAEPWAVPGPADRLPTKP